MSERVPTNAAEVLASAMDVSVSTAKKYIRQAPEQAKAAIAAADAELRAAARVSEVEAWQSIDEGDVEDSASAVEPLADLRATVDRRAQASMRSAIARLGAHESWARTSDRSARTAPAREAFENRFLDQVDPDRKLSAQERNRRAANARKAYFLRLALKSAQVRRERKAQR